MGIHIFPFFFANSASGKNVVPSLFHVCEFMDALQQVQNQGQGVYEFAISVNICQTAYHRDCLKLCSSSSLT